MVDNMPFVVTNPRALEQVFNCGLLKFQRGEKPLQDAGIKEKPKIKASHENLKLDFHLDDNGDTFEKLTVRGSIHYYANQGLHNENNMDFVQFKESCLRLMSNLHLEPNDCHLLPLEFGVNLDLDEINFNGHQLTTLDLVKNTMCETRKAFSNNPINCPTSKISGTNRSESQLKIYGKSDQLHSRQKNREILRLESRQKATRYLRNNGIITLEDLQNIENQIFLKKLLISRLNNVMIFDPTIELPKNNKYHKNLMQYANPNFWLDLIMLSKNNPKQKQQYNYHLAKSRELSKKYGCNLHDKIISATNNQYNKNLGIKP